MRTNTLTVAARMFHTAAIVAIQARDAACAYYHARQLAHVAFVGHPELRQS